MKKTTIINYIHLFMHSFTRSTKRGILVVIALFSITLCNAQDKNLERANKYFARTYYTQAIPLYEKFLKNNQNIQAIKNLADAYYLTNNMHKAAKNYKYLLKVYRKYVDKSYYLKYANSLKAIKKHKEANDVLIRYYKLYDKEKLPLFEKELEYLENVAALGERFTIKNVGINTSASEFGAIQQGNNVIFAAPRKEAQGLGKRFGWNGQQYLDLYSVPVDKIHLGDSVATPFAEKLNTKLHEATLTFTKDGKTVYFTRNSSVKGKRKTDDKKVTHLQLFKANLVDGVWTNITPLPFNANEYSTEHPALSADEKTLYFASDMPNGFGSFDIYQVAIHKDGTFGNPINLGETINTPKREQFPFASKNGNLYFSSNGHPNFGSLDVFVAKKTKEGFAKPDNVGLPVNSGYDDFAFTINPDTKEGFFASNRLGGEGGDDIYKIVEDKPLVIEYCKQYISGVVTDIDTKKVLANAKVLLTDANLKTLEKTTTDASGKFSFTVACKSAFVVTASKAGYTSDKISLKTSKERNKDNNASLALKSLQVLEKEKLVARQKADREKAKALRLQQERERKLKAENYAKLQVKKKKRIENIIAEEDNIVKQKEKIIYKTDEINFDYKLWYLRRDSKKAIDKVIALMKKYPDMIIEVGTHTDIRGNNKYNLELSAKRANSVRMYFMENDIEPDRISARGYGETEPLIKCATEDACTEEQHELNRRCEFVIKQIL